MNNTPLPPPVCNEKNTQFSSLELDLDLSSSKLPSLVPLSPSNVSLDICDDEVTAPPFKRYQHPVRRSERIKKRKQPNQQKNVKNVEQCDQQKNVKILKIYQRTINAFKEHGNIYSNTDPKRAQCLELYIREYRQRLNVMS